MSREGSKLLKIQNKTRIGAILSTDPRSCVSFSTQLLCHLT
jgi:hypothetical protein